MRNSRKKLSFALLYFTLVSQIAIAQSSNIPTQPNSNNEVCSSNWIQKYNDEIQKIVNEADILTYATKYREATVRWFEKADIYNSCVESTSKLVSIMSGGEVCLSEKRAMDLVKSEKNDIAITISTFQAIAELKVKILKQKYSACPITKNENTNNSNLEN